MPQRTIGEAKVLLRGAVLSPDEHHRRKLEIQEKARPFRQQFEAEQDAATDRISDEIVAVKKGLEGVARKLYQLDKQGSLGGMTAAEYRERFAEVMRERDVLSTRAASLNGQVEDFAARDANPRAAIDEMLANYPAIQPHFSF